MSFTLFPKLPSEIRNMIWEATFEPRIVYLFCSTKHTGFYSKAALPPALNVCQESRAFIGARYLPSFGSALSPPRIRVNFELDTIFFVGRKRLVDFDVLLGWESLLSNIAPDDLASIRYLAVDSVMMLSPSVLIYKRPARMRDRRELDAVHAALKRAVVAMANLRELVVVFHVIVLTLDRNFRPGKGQLMLMEGSTFPRRHKICAIEDNEIVRSSDLGWLRDDKTMQKDHGRWTKAPIRSMYGWVGKNGLHLNERGYLDVMKAR